MAAPRLMPVRPTNNVELGTVSVGRSLIMFYGIGGEYKWQYGIDEKYAMQHSSIELRVA